MSDLLATLGSLISALGNAQAGPVLRERLLAFQDDLARVKQELAELRQERDRLRQQLEAAKEELARHAVPQGMTEHRGAYFRRGRDGQWDRTVFCFRCRQPTFVFPPRDGEFNCSDRRCGWVSSFGAMELADVMRGLPAA